MLYILFQLMLSLMIKCTVETPASIPSASNGMSLTTDWCVFHDIFPLISSALPLACPEISAAFPLASPDTCEAVPSAFLDSTPMTSEALSLSSTAA
jgi:hypothetical protein